LKGSAIPQKVADMLVNWNKNRSLPTEIAWRTAWENSHVLIYRQRHSLRF
jgi:hypothetical protein